MTSAVFKPCAVLAAPLRGRLLVVCVCCALLAHAVAAINYIRALPAFNWPDEPAHFNVIRRIAQGRGLDAMTPLCWSPQVLADLKRNYFRDVRGVDDPRLASIRYEAHQPPLYYLVAAGVYRLTGSLTALRLMNLALSLAGILLAARLAALCYPRRPAVLLGSVLLLALLPMRVFMSVAIGNDALAECIFSAAALAIVANAPPLIVGCIVGLGLLTKVHLALLLPLYALWLLMQPEYGIRLAGRLPSGGLWRLVCVAGVTAGLIASPWIVRNLVLYGWRDPLALQVGAWGSAAAEIAAFGVPRPQLSLTGPHGIAAFASLLFQSWWGVFGWMNIFVSPPVLALFVALSLPPLAGLVMMANDGVQAGRGQERGPRAARWACAALALVAASVCLYSLRDFQPQGRYLIVAATAAGLLHGLSVERVFGARAPNWLLIFAVPLFGANLYIAQAIIPWYLAQTG